MNFGIAGQQWADGEEQQVRERWSVQRALSMTAPSLFRTSVSARQGPDQAGMCHRDIGLRQYGLWSLLILAYTIGQFLSSFVFPTFRHMNILGYKSGTISCVGLYLANTRSHERLIFISSVLYLSRDVIRKLSTRFVGLTGSAKTLRFDIY
jgi:hypothetical protein